MEVRCLDLAEEVGELARAVLFTEEHKSTTALADHHHVDLDEPYPRMLTRLVDGHRGDSEMPTVTRRLGGREGPR